MSRENVRYHFGTGSIHTRVLLHFMCFTVYLAHKQRWLHSECLQWNTRCIINNLDYYTFTDTQPVITVQPVSREVRLHCPATFSALVTKGGILKFQWFLNGTSLSNTTDQRISGANQSSMTIRNVQQSDIGSYQLRVMNDVGYIDSDVVQLNRSELIALCTCTM